MGKRTFAEMMVALAILCAAFGVIPSYAYDYVAIPGELVTLGSSASDSDCDYTVSCPPESVTDEVTVTWSDNTGRASSVAFPGGNTGTSVGWRAPASTGDVHITATADDSGTTQYNDDSADDTVTIRVAEVQLESVTFGGSKKHTLYKKGPNQSNPWSKDNENFTEDYTVAVPNKAWVTDAPLADPVCYTRGSAGSESTATIELSISPPLGHSVDIRVIARNADLSVVWFDKSGSITGGSPTIGPMNTQRAHEPYVAHAIWHIKWHIKVDDGDEHLVGTSLNLIFLTWGTPSPSGGKATAKRMDWTTLNCSTCNTTTNCAYNIAQAVHAGTRFGYESELVNYWELLDRAKKGDCLQTADLAKTSLLLLGVPASDVGSQVSYASSDDTADPDYPSDVTDEEYDPLYLPETEIPLLYTDNGVNWNYYEGNFRVYDGGTWTYWTCWPVSEDPFIGTGSDANEKDKSARYKVLDWIRIGNPDDFCQKYGGEGDEIPLP